MERGMRQSLASSSCAPQKLDLAGLIALSSLTELCTPVSRTLASKLCRFAIPCLSPVGPDNSLIHSLIIPCSDLRLKLSVSAGRLALGAGFRGMRCNSNRQKTRIPCYFPC